MCDVSFGDIQTGGKNGSPGEPENAEAERENRQFLADAHGLLGGTDVALGLRPEKLVGGPER